MCPSYTVIGPLWYGDQTPLTLSLIDLTGFVSVFNFSPDASLNKTAFCKIDKGCKFLTQIVFSRPLIYVPLMIGCLLGRGDTVISTLGLEAANLGRTSRRKELGYVRLKSHRYWKRSSRNILHALGTTGPVAVVEVELLALQDECAHAILRAPLASVLD